MTIKNIAVIVLPPFFFFSILPSPGVLASEISYVDTETGAPIAVKAFDPEAAAPAATPAGTVSIEDSLSPADSPLSAVGETEISADSGDDSAGALSNDTYYGTYTMWGFDRVKAEQAWAESRGAGVTIAVIDTGLYYDHEDILGNVFTNSGEVPGDGLDNDGNGYVDDTRGWDFVNNDNSASDDNGHGSHVSGIAAAVSDNAKGIAGVAPDAKILPVKVLDAGGSGTIANVIAGIKYAANLGAKIINMSLGIAKKFLSSSLLGAFQDAVDYALGKGAVTVTAAGNESVDANTTAPAGLNNTIAVGATNDRNRKASFSNKNPDLAAPGVEIGSLYKDGGYVYMSGTSMSSPYAAGAAALIYSKFSSLYSTWTGSQTYNDIYTRLTRSALDLGKKGYDSSFGYGLLNAYAALTYSSGGSSSFTDSSSSNGQGGGSGNGNLASSSFSETPIYSGLFSGNWYRIGALENQPKKKIKI